MSIANNQPYFMMRWGYTGSAWAYARQFRLVLQDAHPGAVVHLETNARNPDGKMITVKAPLAPRMLGGTIRANFVDAPGYGNYDELKLAYLADDLECKAWDDSDYWKAKWTGEYDPGWLDPMGNFFMTSIKLEQRE
jgi:hypothetical protein